MDAVGDSAQFPPLPVLFDVEIAEIPGLGGVVPGNEEATLDFADHVDRLLVDADLSLEGDGLLLWIERPDVDGAASPDADVDCPQVQLHVPDAAPLATARIVPRVLDPPGCAEEAEARQQTRAVYNPGLYGGYGPIMDCKEAIERVGRAVLRRWLTPEPVTGAIRQDDAWLNPVEACGQGR